MGVGRARGGTVGEFAVTRSLPEVWQRKARLVGRAFLCTPYTNMDNESIDKEKSAVRHRHRAFYFAIQTKRPQASTSSRLSISV
jgi:hypothetical protein